MKSNLSISSIKSSVVLAIAVLVASHYVHYESIVLMKYYARCLAFAPMLHLSQYTGLYNFAYNDWDGSGIYHSQEFFSTKEDFDYVTSFEPRDNEVFIVTYPKSGTHFIAQLVVQLIGSGESEFDHIQQKVSFMEWIGKGDSGLCQEERMLNLYNARRANTTNGKRIYASHLNQQHFPYSGKGKYVIMVRNPVDTLASLRKMIKNMVGPLLVPTWDNLYYYNYKFGNRGWFEHYKQWWLLKNKSNVLFIFYEDAISDHEGTVRQVMNFLDIPTNETIVQKVVELSSLQFMKKHSKKFELPSCLFENKPFVHDSLMNKEIINRGKAGHGKLEVPMHIRNKMKKDFDEAFQNSGFPTWRYENKIV